MRYVILLSLALTGCDQPDPKIIISDLDRMNYINQLQLEEARLILSTCAMQPVVYNKCHDTIDSLMLRREALK